MRCDRITALYHFNNASVLFHSQQLHFLGEILGGEGFASGIWCKFAVESGKYWTLLSGATTGQTHVGYDLSSNSNL